MKKVTKIVLGLTLAATVAATAGALAACDGTKTYNGSYSYANTHTEGHNYGVKVHVKVDKDNKIVKVTCDADTESFYNITPTWDNAETAKGQLDEYLKKFEGKTVEEVKALKVATVSAEEAGGYNPQGQPKNDADSKAAWEGYVLTGATQTAGRIVLAVQDALKNVK